MEDATVALRIQRRLQAERQNNFGIVTSDTFMGMFRQITAGIFACRSASSPSRSSSAAS